MLRSVSSLSGFNFGDGLLMSSSDDGRSFVSRIIEGIQGTPLWYQFMVGSLYATVEGVPLFPNGAFDLHFWRLGDASSGLCILVDAVDLTDVSSGRETQTKLVDA